MDQWVGRYRGGGLAALRPRKAKGGAAKLTCEQRAVFRARALLHLPPYSPELNPAERV